MNANFFKVVNYAILLLIILSVSIDADAATEGENNVSYDNQYTCGLFPSVLTSYTHITSNGNNDQACYTADIAYPEGELTGDITCNPNGCGGTSSCQRINPPLNRYSPSFPTNSKSSTANGTNPTELTDLEYGNLTYGNNNTIHFNPSNTYSDNNTTKVILLGDVNASKSTLQFEPGDYYFDSLTIDSNGNTVELPNGGPVRIFIKHDFSVNMNNLNFDTNGSQNDLFVYVGGNFNSLGNGGGTTSWKAYMYVKGTTTLNNNSNNWEIYGGITTEGNVTINGNNPHFIQKGDKGESFGYGECQMCYGTPVGSDGINMFGMNACTNATPCNMNVPVRNLDNAPLNDVTITELHKSAASFSWGSHYSVLDKDGNEVADTNASKESKTSTDLPMGFNISTENKAIIYNAGDNYPTYSPNQNYYQMHKKITFSISREKFSNIIYTGKYTDSNGREYNIQLEQCEESTNSSNNITGPFDAWDTFRNISDRNISTKIANRDFNLTIASVNKTNTATERKDNIDIKYALYDWNNKYNITNWRDFNASQNSKINADFNVSNAYRNIRVIFKFCADYDGNNYTLYSYNRCKRECSSNDEKTSGNPCFRKAFSSDNFAIRPYSFRVFGENQYKRAGEDFNLTIKAVDENNDSLNKGSDNNVTGVSGYNANLSDLNIKSHFYEPTDDQVRQMNIDVYDINDTNRSRVAYCPHAGTFSINNASNSFENGEVNASLKFSETGILDVNVSEKPGHEWALVDADDTNDSQRYIKPATMIVDENNLSAHDLLLFVPYKFDTIAEYNATNGKNWLYMYDINGSNITFTTPKIAAYIKYTIKAKNKDGNIVQNYTRTCFPDVDEVHAPRVNGLKLNTTFDLFLDADLNSSLDANISLYTEDNSSNAIWVLTKNINLVQGNNSIREWIGPTNFENGVGIAKLYFNIDKNNSIAKNPMKIEVIDANTSTSWMSNPGSPKEFNGDVINQEKIFYYGRVHAPDYETDKKSVNTPIYVEVYCNSDEVNCTYFNISGWEESKDDVYWWINKNHNNPKDGNVSSLIATPNADININPTSFSSFLNGVKDINISYNGSNYPYKIRIEITPSSWLKYDKFDQNANPTYNVTFKGGSGWAGVGKTGKTVDMNVSKKTSQRIEW